MTKKMKPNSVDAVLFEEYLDKKGLNVSSIALYRSVITEFIIRDPELEKIDDYNNFLLEHTYKKRSNYYYFAIRSFVKYKIQDLSLKNMIIKNLIKPKIEDPRRNNLYLTNIKREKVINDLESWKHRIIAKIQNQTAARVGDVLKLKRGSIAFENVDGEAVMKLEFIGKRNKKSIKWIFDKSLQNEIMEFIDENYLDEEYYFVEFTGKGLHRNTSELNRIRGVYHAYLYDLKKALYKNKVDYTQWSTHDFRRNVSREIWDDPELGKDVQLLQQYLAHQNASTTLRYLRHSGMSNKEVSKRIAMKTGKI